MNLKEIYKDYLPRYCLMSLTCLFSQPKFDGSLQLLYRHFSIYAVNLGRHKKAQKQKPRKPRLLSSTKGEENRIEL